MPDKKLNLDGIDLSVFNKGQKKELNLDGIDMSVFGHTSHTTQPPADPETSTTTASLVQEPQVLTTTIAPEVHEDRKLKDRHLESIAADYGLLDKVSPVNLQDYTARKDAIQPHINGEIFDAKAYTIQKQQQEKQDLDQKVSESANTLQLPEDLLRKAVHLNEMFNASPEPEKKRSDYILGSVSQFNEGLADVARTVDRVGQLLSESAGFEWKNPIFRDIADALHNVGEAAPYKTPDTIGGDIAAGLSRMAPDLLATMAMPEMKLAELPTITKGIVTQIPKFPVYLGLKEGLHSYDTAGEGADRYADLYKGIARGFKEGLIYEAMGLTGKQAGKVAEAMSGSKVVSEAVSGLASGTQFGAHALITNPEVIKDGKVNWELAQKEFWTNFGMGIAFHAKGIGEGAIDLSRVNQSAARKAHAAFWTSNRDLIKQGFASPKSQVELRKQSQDLWEKAINAGSAVEKNQYLMAKTAVDNMIASKAYALAVARDPKFFKEELNKSEFLTDQEKQFYKDRIDQTKEDYKYVLESAKNGAKVAPEIMSELKTSEEGGKEKLAETANNLSDKNKKLTKKESQTTEFEVNNSKIQNESSQKVEPMVEGGSQKEKSYDDSGSQASDQSYRINKKNNFGISDDGSINKPILKSALDYSGGIKAPVGSREQIEKSVARLEELNKRLNNEELKNTIDYFKQKINLIKEIDKKREDLPSDTDQAIEEISKINLKDYPDLSEAFKAVFDAGKKARETWYNNYKKGSEALGLTWKVESSLKDEINKVADILSNEYSSLKNIKEYDQKNKKRIQGSESQRKELEQVKPEQGAGEKTTDADRVVQTPQEKVEPKKRKTFLNLLDFFHVNKKGKVKIKKTFYDQLTDEVTKKSVKEKTGRLLEEKQKEFDQEMQQIKDLAAKDAQKGEFVDISVGGKQTRMKVTQLPDGSFDVKTWGKNGFRKKVTVDTIRQKAIAEYKDKVAKIDWVIDQHRRDLENKIFDDIENEIKAYVGERETARPEPAKSFSDKAPVQPTVPSEGKKKRMPLPSEGTKVTVDEGKDMKAQIRMEARAAREAKRFTEKEFREVSESIKDKFKQAVDKKHITGGQYRSVINRISKATTPRAREKALDYVDKIIEGSEYRGQVKKAESIQRKVRENNKKASSVFGDAKPLADEFISIDPGSLTMEELYRFNSAASRIFLSNKKAPGVSAMEGLVSEFKDRIKDTEKIERITDSKQLNELIDKIGEDIASVGTVREFLGVSRNLSMARNKAAKLLDEGKITEDEFIDINKKIGKTDFEKGEFEQQLQEFKDDYAAWIIDNVIPLDGIKKAVSELPDKIRKPIKELLTVDKKTLGQLPASDIEAFDTALFDLQAGYQVPYLAELQRKINVSKTIDKDLSPALENVSKSARLEKLRKYKFTGPKASIINKLFGKNKDEYDNLRDLIFSIKSHRIDTWLGNFNKLRTVGSRYTAVARKMQMEINEKSELQDRRIKAIDKFSKGRKNPQDDIKKIGMFLIERSWQKEKSFLEDKLSKESASIMNGALSDATRTSAKDKSAFDRDRTLYFDLMEEARQVGATKNYKGQEIIDTEAFYQHLASTDKKAKALIDFVDQYLADMEPTAKWAMMQNGRTYIPKEQYFPFRRKEMRSEVNAETVRNYVEGNVYEAKMQANSTYGRDGVVQWLDTDIFHVLENHTNELLRNYYVYPELKVSVEALKKAGKQQDKINVEKYGDSRDVSFITSVLAEDIAGRVGRAYHSGRYAVEYDATWNRILKGSKKGMLINPARVPSELTANYARASISIGNISPEILKKSKEDKGVYNSIMEEYVGNKYWSRYSPDVGGTVFRNEMLHKIETAADWMIVVSDRAIGKPLFVKEFDKSFKDLTGKEFDAKEYLSNEDYYINNKEYIDKSATWAVRRLEELFNDKSILTTPQLTRFLGGIIKADPSKKRTQIFDILQSFNRNEVDQLVDAGRRLRYGDMEQKWMAYRDLVSITSSNLLYQTLRRGFGVGFSIVLANVLGQKLTDYDRENKKELLTAKRLMQDFRKSTFGLAMGGSSQIYGYASKWMLYVLDKSDIIDDTAKQKIYDILEEDLYIRPIKEVGTVRSVTAGVLPLPSPVIKDMFDGMDGAAAIMSAVSAAVEGKHISDKQWYEIASIFNLGMKYFMPNPVSPTLQKVIDRERAKYRNKTDKKSKSDSTEDLILRR